MDIGKGPDQLARYPILRFVLGFTFSSCEDHVVTQPFAEP